MIREESIKNVNDVFASMTHLLDQQFDMLETLMVDVWDASIWNCMHENEKLLDRMEICARTTVVNEMLRLTPRACDLRRIIAMLNMVIDLERMGDLLYSSGKRLDVVMRSNNVWNQYRMQTYQLFSGVKNMYMNCVFAFNNENLGAAQNTISQDDEVDACYHNTHRLLFESDVCAADMPAYLALSRLLYLFERIGDSCTNIAEDTVCLINGVNMKHQNK